MNNKGNRRDQLRNNVQCTKEEKKGNVKNTRSL